MTAPTAIDPDLTATLDRWRALHQPQRRYTDADGEYSCDTAREAAEVFAIPLDAVAHFDICEHCGQIETGDDTERPYRESLWPCADARAFGTDARSR